MFFDTTYNSKILELYKHGNYDQTGESILGVAIVKDNIARFEKKKSVIRKVESDEVVSDAVLYTNYNAQIEEEDVINVFDKKGIVSLGLFKIVDLRKLDALTVDQKNLELELQEYRA